MLTFQVEPEIPFIVYGYVLMGVGAIMMMGSQIWTIKRPKNEEVFRHDKIMIIGVITFIIGCLIVFAGWYEG